MHTSTSCMLTLSSDVWEEAAYLQWLSIVTVNTEHMHARTHTNSRSCHVNEYSSFVKRCHLPSCHKRTIISHQYAISLSAANGPWQSLSKHGIQTLERSCGGAGNGCGVTAASTASKKHPLCSQRRVTSETVPPARLANNGAHFSDVAYWRRFIIRVSNYRTPVFAHAVFSPSFHFRFIK